MRLTYQFRRLAFAQVVLGIVAFCLAEPNPGLLLIAGAIAGLSWYVAEGPTGKPIPHWAVNLGVFPALGWMGYDLAGGGGSVVVAVGHFTMALQVLMLYARKTNREYVELLVLSVLQMVGASVLSMSVIFGVMLAGYCGLALVTLLVFQLKSTSDRVQEHNRAAAGDREAAEVPPPRDVVGRSYRWHLRGSAIVIALVCLVCAAVVFVAVPRQPAHPGRPGAASSMRSGSRTGFNDRIDLNGGPPRRVDRQPVLNLTVTRAGRRLDDPGGRAFLLRGAALDVYDPRTHTWNRDPRHAENDKPISLPGGEGDGEGDGVRLASLPPGTPMMRGEVTLREPGVQNLFTVQPITAIASPAALKLAFNPVDQRLTLRQSRPRVTRYTMRWPAGPVAGLRQRYERVLGPVTPIAFAGSGAEKVHHGNPPVDPAADHGTDPGTSQNTGHGVSPDAPPPSASSAAHHPAPARALADHPAPAPYTRWSVQRRRVADKARAILRRRGITPPPAEASAAPAHPLIVARTLAAWLRRHDTYTLANPPPTGDQDPVIAFLFDNPRGHCELFAAGLTALCRSLRIPARVVTGYRAGDYNPMGGYYVVRESDAHAWTEVYGGAERGWRTVDATPPAAVEAEHADRGWFAPARRFYDYLEFSWVHWVVAFDQRTRGAVLGGMKRKLADAADPRKSWVGKAVAFVRKLPRDWDLDRISYTLAGVVLVMIGVGLFILARLLLARRRRLVALQLHTLERGNRRHLGRKLHFYLVMLEMLERHGYTRPRWQSPFGFAQELAEANPMKFDPVLALTELFYEVRFGYRDLDEDRHQRIRAHLKQLETALAPHPH